MKPLISIVSAVYNVVDYLPDYFISLENQTIGEELFEVVLVNDGSSDESEEVCIQWMDNTNLRVKLISQANSGVSNARNRGLQAATGKWICFADPDDWLHADFLFEMARFIFKLGSQSPNIIAGRSRIVREESHPRSDKKCISIKTFPHPLEWRFDKKSGVVDVGKYPHLIQLATNCCLINKRILDQEKFNEEVRPTFEDAELIVRILRHDSRIGLCRQASYYYRKRSTTKTSITSQSFERVEKYTDLFDTALIPLIESTKGTDIERYVINLVFYEIGWIDSYIRQNGDYKLFFSTARGRNQMLSHFRARAIQVFGSLDKEKTVDVWSHFPKKRIANLIDFLAKDGINSTSFKELKLIFTDDLNEELFYKFMEIRHNHLRGRVGAFLLRRHFWFLYHLLF
ncbi:hypothetical protein BSR29_00510 [Boudabousia liubingyangii]|uniref:Glycosyltransferase 2-like domain-containing protein n=1 Tax=Boudabousia liubingyangii TaxID=1921764 RepID=A0A1Q5PPN3_9ACTO|nr:glycosyltransferase [Boudabousia liubingyangii]OKL49479.1 hypothetical protein BSR29_00510 [Boudabousia liubingyangii]